jgi:hypothetical protein
MDKQFNQHTILIDVVTFFKKYYFNCLISYFKIINDLILSFDIYTDYFNYKVMLWNL